MLKNLTPAEMAEDLERKWQLRLANLSKRKRFLLRVRLIWDKLRIAFGRLVNKLGLPGFIADTDYEATICKASIRVRRHTLFTIISVNGLDIYFYRFTGHIDGVGFSPDADCKLAHIQGSRRPVGLHVVPPGKVQT